MIEDLSKLIKFNNPTHADQNKTVMILRLGTFCVHELQVFVFGVPVEEEGETGESQVFEEIMSE